jgi:hypothetical protein
MEMIVLKCNQCGKQFTRELWQHKASLKRAVNKVLKIYCSVQCHHKATYSKKKRSSNTNRPNNFIPNREICTSCNKREIYIIDTNKNKLGHRYRRKECRNCGERFTTYEVPDEYYKNHLNINNPSSSILKQEKNKRINNCYLCIHNDQEKDRCGYEIPEYKTAYSGDCFYFKKEES